MNKEITNKNVNDPKLVFIGTEGNTEYYLDFKNKDMRGWSFLGLCHETEENLREQARERDPIDTIGISRHDFEMLDRYFDWERWQDDAEADWYEGSDILGEREESGITYYLCIGSGTDIFHYFTTHNIADYDSYCQHFDEIGLDEETFNKVNNIVKDQFDKNVFKMTEEERVEERELLANIFLK